MLEYFIQENWYKKLEDTAKKLLNSFLNRGPSSEVGDPWRDTSVESSQLNKQGGDC